MSCPFSTSESPRHGYTHRNLIQQHCIGCTMNSDTVPKLLDIPLKAFSTVYQQRHLYLIQLPRLQDMGPPKHRFAPDNASAIITRDYLLFLHNNRI